jgi:hypothetical protein
MATRQRELKEMLLSSHNVIWKSDVLDRNSHVWQVLINAACRKSWDITLLSTSTHCSVTTVSSLSRDLGQETPYVACFFTAETNF